MVSLCGASMQSDIIISFGWIVYCLLARRSSFPVSTIPAFAIDYQGRWSAFSVELLKLEGGGGKIKVNICDVISVALLYNTKWFGQIRTIFQSLLAGYQCSQQKDLLLPAQKRQFNSDNSEIHWITCRFLILGIYGTSTKTVISVRHNLNSKSMHK